MLRRFSFWIVLAVSVMALAGFLGTVQLQRAINHTRDAQASECQAVAQLQRSTLAILSAIEADPTTSAAVRQTIRRQEPKFTRALQASHHCD